MSNSSSPPRQQQNRLLWQRLTVAAADLSLADQYAKVLIAKDWTHSVLTKRRRYSTYLHQSAYTTAFVVAYSRPFTETRRWPTISLRLLALSVSEQALHRRLLDLRNTVYAHSDVGARNLRKFTMFGEPFAIQRVPSMHLELTELHAARAMLAKSQAAIQSRIASLAAGFPDDA